MRYKSSLSIKLTVLLLVACVMEAASQQVSDAYQCARELMILQKICHDSTYVSFQTEQIRRYNDATSDTVRCQYKLSANKVHTTASDGIEYIQNNGYSLLLQHKRGKALLDKPGNFFKMLAHANITEASFKDRFVAGMTLGDSAGLKKLSFNFKPASPYRQYTILYEKSTYRIRAIEYVFNIGGAASAPPNSKMPFTATILFSNYQTNGFTDAAFSIDGYIEQNNGIVTMAAPYAGYKLINSVNQ